MTPYNLAPKSERLKNNTRTSHVKTLDQTQAMDSDWEEEILPENLKKIEFDFGIRKTLHPKAWYYDESSITLAQITTEIKINKRSCWPSVKRVIKNRDSNGPSEYLS